MPRPLLPEAAVSRLPAPALIGALVRSRYSMAVAALGFFAFAVAAERDPKSLPFVFIIGAMVSTVAFALTARPRFSVFVAALVLTLSTLASMAKFKMVAMNAHVFDLWFHMANAETVAFLATEFRGLALTATATIIALAASAALIWRFDHPVAFNRAPAAVFAFYCAVCAPIALPREASDFFYHIRTAHFMSSFFTSFADLSRLGDPVEISRRIGHAPGQAPFALHDGCPTAADFPDIILTLSESAVPPASIPGWKFDPSINDYFKSWDGGVHKARAETHGNGTWVSHTSVNSGLSMADFGWMRPYATMLLRDRIRHGLADALARCGYKTAFITPLSYRFVNEGPMLTSLGFLSFRLGLVIVMPLIGHMTWHAYRETIGA